MEDVFIFLMPDSSGGYNNQHLEVFSFRSLKTLVYYLPPSSMIDEKSDFSTILKTII
jgi:hypothetical protein